MLCHAFLSMLCHACLAAVCCSQKDLFADKTGEYWGKFGATQQSIQQAYTGNAAANVDAASSGMLG